MKKLIFIGLLLAGSTLAIKEIRDNNITIGEDNSNTNRTITFGYGNTNKGAIRYNYSTGKMMASHDNSSFFNLGETDIHGTINQIPYFYTTTGLLSTAKMWWDNTNNSLLIGASDTMARFPAAQFISSKGNTAHWYTGTIGVIGEATSDGTDTSTGVGGVASSNGAQAGRGVVGVGKVSNTADTGKAIGGQFRSNDTHAGDSNIAVQATASGGAANYSFYGLAGTIRNDDETNAMNRNSGSLVIAGGAGFNANVFAESLYARAVESTNESNIFPNGRFTIGTEGWAANASCLSVVKNDVYDPRGSAEIFKDSTNCSAKYVYYAFTMPPRFRGRKILATVYGQGNANYAASDIFLVVQDMDAATQKSIAYFSTGNSKAESAFSATSTSINYQLRLGFNTSSTTPKSFYFSGVTLRDADATFYNLTVNDAAITNLYGGTGFGTTDRIIYRRSADSLLTGTATLTIDTNGLNVNANTVGGLTARFGAVSTNNATFESDGTLVLNGNATGWKDIAIPASNLKSGVTTPAYVDFRGGIYQTSFEDGKVQDLYGSFEYAHDCKENTNAEVHIHWTPSTSNTGNSNIQFDYVIADTNGNYAATATTLNKLCVGSGDVNRHQYCSLGNINGTGIHIGADIKFKLSRNGTATDDDGTYNSIVSMVGVHCEIDTPAGSRTQSSK